MKVNNGSLKLKRLDWYIIKKFLGTYLFMIALIISIAWYSTSTRRLISS